MKERSSFLKLFYSFITAAFLFFPLFSLAQVRTITGRVVDSTGAGIERVTVKVKGTSTGTATSADGSFAISVTSASPVLVFSNIGYQVQEIKPGDQNTVAITLLRINETLSDVVVIGYTQQSKAKNIAAISRLNPEELKNTSNPNAVQEMQGKIAGVSIPITSGQPGLGAGNIIIRGGTKTDVYGTGQTNGAVNQTNGTSATRDGGGAGLGPTSANSNPYVLID
jgi:hypothetical protein